MVADVYDRIIETDGLDSKVGDGVSADDIAPREARQIWERLPGEPTLWYERFWTYAFMGPTRTIRSTHAIHTRIETDKLSVGSQVGQAWYTAMYRWKWRERAAAYDDYERMEAREQMKDSREKAKLRRMRAIEDVLSGVTSILRTVDLFSMTREEAMVRLPTILSMFDTAIKHHRLEYGEATEITETTVASVTGDDLARAKDELEKWKIERESKNEAETSGFNPGSSDSN